MTHSRIVRLTLSMLFIVLSVNGWNHASASGESLHAFIVAGAPLKTVHGKTKAGLASIFYCGTDGVTATYNHLLSQDSEGAEDQCEVEDYFGLRYASGDFNGDGFGDIAVGIPNEDIGAVHDAGAVQIFTSTERGLSASIIQDQWIDPEMLSGIDTTENDLMGLGVTAGDFNGDGYDDLAVGIPRYDESDLIDAGIVLIFNGSGAGLLMNTFARFWQDTDGIGGAAESYDFFGNELGAGDFDGDGFDDLVVGVPGEAIGDVSRAGCVNLIYGSAAGLTGTGSQIFWQGWNNEIKELAEAGDQFGSVIATGDFNHDGYDDLAVSAVDEQLWGSSGEVRAGAVTILIGSAEGITTENDLFFSATNPEDGSRVGEALAVGDLNHDGYEDLIIGAPGRHAGGVERSGEILINFGKSGGLSEINLESHHQDDGLIPGTNEEFDDFGAAIACADLNGDGFDDLAIGVPGETLEKPISLTRAGAMITVYGSASGIVSQGARVWTFDSAGVEGDPAANDYFGEKLAIVTGNFVMPGCTETGVTLWMPAHSFAPGDPCACTATVCNSGATSLVSYPLFVLLDIAGTYYFAPSFTTYDNYADICTSFPVGETLVDVLPEFTWPTGAGTFSGCMFYGALTDPGVTALFGTMDSFFFNWTE